MRTSTIGAIAALVLGLGIVQTKNMTVVLHELGTYRIIPVSLFG